ncbi:type I pullulanase [Haloplasma contractile]|uniref:Glycosyl hydrolase family 13 catalytic domain-containing protein n=1 Tax=Haloplasma contractile SSD-17B TaxID=1033810 RepID=U2DYR1_9MOLU|nr:type I pullulanase [Haloplasma contractile]ERJ13382.1 Pullulanase putative protein [Haloplasma contractile SSD-17B]
MDEYKKYDQDEFNETFFYEGSDLGAIYTKEKTTFKVWSPDASKIILMLYDKGYNSKPYDKIKMKKDEKGTFTTVVSEDLQGVYYTYEVHHGKTIYETVDIYAKACSVNGQRGMVVDLDSTNPEGFENDTRPTFVHPTDAIIYEAHVRDLTIHRSAGCEHPGKFLGLAEVGTTSPEGLATGIDHLVEMGITHLHLLPIFDFGSIDETKPELLQYNWGYAPVNYNIPEGSFSTNPLDGTVRIQELKQLIQTLHKKGIRVIMDVVYNHTQDSSESNFHKTVPYYYHRLDENGNFSNGSGCGNELASERPMVRKYIIDSLLYWVEEYHVDGFRFDLMGLHDVKTMNEIREALDQVDATIITYGEGWTAEKTPLPVTEQAIKNNIHKMPRIAAFSDEGRDGIKGHVMYRDQPGFVNGAINMEETVKFSIVAATEHPQVDYDNINYSKKPWANQPHQTINYVSCHDNLTLYDKLVETTEGLDMETRIKMHKMSNAIVLTSQGIPFLHAGVEFLRTKNGDENSYKSPDTINEIVWHSKYDHREIVDYYKGLIRLRKEHPAFRMTTTEQIQTHLEFIDPSVSNTIGYTITNSANGDVWEDIAVLFNANTSEVKFKLPHFGVWNIVVDGERAGTETIRSFTGDEIVIKELTSMVLYSNEKQVNEVKVVERNKTNFKNVAVAAGVLGAWWLLRRGKKK